MFKTLKRCVSFVIVVAGVFALATAAAPPRVHAESFGGQGYGECAYGSACSNAETGAHPDTNREANPGEEQQQTILELPTGLEVAVNLHEGQVIPPSGYTIVVTPLNGQGGSFVKVDFYIDDILAGTSTPDETGTVRWRWDPQVHAGTVVKVVVTGQDGSVVTQSFTVSLAQDTAYPAPKPSGSSNGPFASLEQFIQSLPQQVIVGFPYVLFMLLACNILLVLVLAYRELQTVEAEHRQLEHARQIAQAKKTFVELASHYLRTPLTLLLGGIDMLKSDNTALPTALEQGAARLSGHITRLVDQARSATNEPPTATSSENARVWLRPWLYVPLVLTAVLVAAFHFLVSRASDFKPGEIHFATQLIIFFCWLYCYMWRYAVCTCSGARGGKPRTCGRTSRPWSSRAKRS